MYHQRKGIIGKEQWLILNSRTVFEYEDRWRLEVTQLHDKAVFFFFSYSTLILTPILEEWKNISESMYYAQDLHRLSSHSNNNKYICGTVINSFTANDLYVMAENQKHILLGVCEENLWKGPLYKGFHTVKDNCKEWYPIQILMTVERQPAPGLS